MVELLAQLFPDGLDTWPRLSRTSAQSFTLNALGLAHDLRGQPSEAIPFYERAAEMAVFQSDQVNRCSYMDNLSSARRVSGTLYLAEALARAALIIGRDQEDLFAERASLEMLGLSLTARGMPDQARTALRRSLRISIAQSHQTLEGVVTAYLSEHALCLDDTKAAKQLADRAWDLADVLSLEGDVILAARLQGHAALQIGDLDTAEERLHHALTRARAVQLVEEELPTLVALAELRRQQGQPGQARELLEDVWEPAERGPYPLFHADALNVLAQLERDAGNEEAAIKAATAAYRHAWCDGPPFAYHWGLEKARQHLAALAAPEPDMPPFDESKFEPMPQVEINPPNEFGGEGELSF